MDLSVIIPCYNEEENVAKLKNELLPVLADLASSQSVEAIFVDDGSADNTWDALQSAFSGSPSDGLIIRFEKHPVNKGLGAAIRTGLGAAQGEVVVSTDSDGTYRFESIPDMLAYLNPEIDIVTASPYHPQGDVVGVPAYRLILSRGSSTIYRLIVKWNIYTYTCLYRAYRRPVVEDIEFESNGYLAGTELMVKAMLKGYQVAEYPAVLHTREYGASKAKILQTISAHLKFQGRVLLHRLHIKSLVNGEKSGSPKTA